VTNSSLLSAGSAIGNHLWQTTVFTAAIGLVTLFLRNNPARIRYSLWLAASVKFLLPFSLLITLGSLLPKSHGIAPSGMYSAMGLAGEPFSELLPAPTRTIARAPTLRERVVRNLPVGLGTIWICGMGTVVLMWFVRWHKFALTLRRSRAAHTGREVNLLRRVEHLTGRLTPIPVRLSSDPWEPGIFGIWRPILLWPEQLSARLDDQHIETILAHELMHVRRHDNLTAALHMLVEAFFWFHPLVWWIERRMVDERERACDEAVVELGGKPEAYAESLLKTCRFCVESPLKCVSGITGAGLNNRIVSIMTMKMIDKLSPGRKLLLFSIGIAAVFAPLVLGEVKAMRGSGVSLVKPLAPPAPQIFPTIAGAQSMPGMSNVANAAQSSATPRVSPGPQTNAKPQTLPGSPSHLSFEVASIKPSHANSLNALIKPYTGGDGYTVQNMPVKDMINVIYRVPRRQVIGGPDWISSERFDIEAKADRAYGLDDLHAMFQNMLVERFNLKTHKETKEGPVYDLTIAKSGLKMKHDGTGQYLKIPILPAPKGVTGTNVSMQYFCFWLGQMLQNDARPVIDKTGLTKDYDFTLSFAPELPPGVSRDQMPSELLDLPSLFDALTEQLGLQLTPAKGPVEYYVIDHIEKPSPN
jgi:bla regulator protein BlaR1